MQTGRKKLMFHGICKKKKDNSFNTRHIKTAVLVRKGSFALIFLQRRIFIYGRRNADKTLELHREIFIVRIAAHIGNFCSKSVCLGCVPIKNSLFFAILLRSFVKSLGFVEFLMRHPLQLVGLRFIIQIMLLYCREGFVADHVLDTAGILACGFLVNAESHQHIG